MDQHKEGLVVNEYTQTYGFDYEETFALVANMNTVRIILSSPLALVWKLCQLDVKSSQGELGKMYMEILPGYGFDNGGNKVCKLRKVLDGLKLSPYVWFGRFTQAMLYLGY